MVVAGLAEAGPGPSTLASGQHEQSPPTRSLSLSSKRLSSSSSSSISSVSRRCPVSILRNSSRRSLPTGPRAFSFDSPSLDQLADMSSAAAPSPSPGFGPDDGVLAFPPLPPLPPFPRGSSNSNRKSAPPSTTAATSQTCRGVRPRRSRVSFREEVDVAAVDDMMIRSASTTTTTSRRPLSHGSPPLSATGRRPSADGDAAVRKSTITPRPALKRASSSQPLSIGTGPIVELGSTASVATLDLDFDDFRPQTLRYPKVSAALARLSDGSMPSAIWTACPSRTGSFGPLPPAPPAAATASPQSLSPAASASSSAATTTTPVPTATAAAAAATTPGRKAGRAPRSPIPSWSSICPSLVSSSASHRASVASTLTAPSMTSLLLSPSSPYDRLPNLPSPAYDDATVVLRDTGDSDDVSDIDMLAYMVRSTGGGNVSGAEASEPAKLRLLQAQPLPPPPPPPPSCMRPRRSEPISASSFDAPSSYTHNPPRAAERLLKLQSSLADLRMQRRQQEQSPERDTRQRRASADRASDAPAPFRPRESPPSPTVADLVRHTPRSSIGPRDSRRELNLDSDDESDLDLSLPLMNAALRSRVIPSSSRLLVSAPPRPLSAQGDRTPAGHGWSGSESEEEEFSRTVARIAMRKVTASAAGGSLPTRRVMKRPSLPATRMNRFSEFAPSFASRLDGGSIASNGSSPSSGPPTPGDRPPRPATAIGTTRSSGTAALITALVEQKYASREALPRPKRFVEGWGAPEVLHDDEWPPDNGAELDDDDDDDDW